MYIYNMYRTVLFKVWVVPLRGFVYKRIVFYLNKKKVPKRSKIFKVSMVDCEIFVFLFNQEVPKVIQ